MFSLNVWHSLSLSLVVIFVSGYEYATGVGYLNTHCPLCNTAYSIYTRFLRMQIVLLSILGSLNAGKLVRVKRFVEEKAENWRLSVHSNGKHFSFSIILSVAIVRVYADFRLDSLWIFRLTNHFTFLFTLRCSMQFVQTLAAISDVYNGLKEEIRFWNVREVCRREGAENESLKKYMVVGSEIRSVQETANEAFGKQACLIQFGILFGCAINAYLLAYLNLQGWSSTSLNLFLFLGTIEYGFAASSFAVSGQLTSDSARAFVVEITRSSVRLRNLRCFESAKQLALSSVNEPLSITAWTFYPLNMESLFSTVSTTAAFVFVLLQFNSVYSNFDLPLD